MRKKILIIGYGSIGKKHENILKKYFNNFSIAISSKHLKKKVNDFNQNNYFAAVIASPSTNHLEDLKKIIKKGIHTLVEKPLSNKPPNTKLENLILKTIKEKKVLIQTAYCLRFHPAIKFLKNFLRKNKFKNILNIEFRTNSYLPLWRMGNYKKHVSANKNKGGGVLNELSHEIDLILNLFGVPKVDIARVSNSGKLKINTEDNADIIFKTNFKTNINMHLDFNSLPERREISIIFKTKKILVDLINNKVQINTKNSIKIKKYNINKDFIYVEQFKHFLKNIKNKKFYNSSFRESIEILKIIKSVKQYY